jgi:glycolate oxidase FAD binding subunit
MPAAVAGPLWLSVRNQTHAFFSQASTLWRLSVPSTAAQTAGAHAQLIEWGGALRWFSGDASVADMRALAAGVGGSAMHWRGGSAGGRFHPLAPSVLELHRRLKARFDPHGIFNPGRLVADI